MIRLPKIKGYHVDKQSYSDFAESLSTIPLPQENLGASSEPTMDVYGYALDNPGKPTIFIQGNIHGNEWVTAYTVRDFIIGLVNDSFPSIPKSITGRLKANFNWYFIPCLNPWGFDNLKRRNKNNVDINRDYADFSQPEGIISRDKLLEKKPFLFIDVHDGKTYTPRPYIWHNSAHYKPMYRDIQGSLNLTVGNPFWVERDEPLPTSGRDFMMNQPNPQGIPTISHLIETERAATPARRMEEGLNHLLIDVLYAEHYLEKRLLTMSKLTQ